MDPLALLRGVHLLCLASLLGTLTGRCWVSPRFEAARVPLVRVARASLLLAIVSLAGWLAGETASLAGAGSPAELLAALPTVVQGTHFGNVLALRLLMLLLIWPLLRGGWWSWLAASVLAAAAIAAQGLIGHAGAAGGREGAILVTSEGLHLTAAGIWLGGLLPLLLLLRDLPPAGAALAARRFMWVGLPAVLVLAMTAWVQADALAGGFPGLLGTGYGHLLLGKLGLLLVLTCLAALNRLVLTPRLAAGARARGWMQVTAGLEILLGGVVILLAAQLASGLPGLHTPPDWPFAWRPSMAALADPEIGQEVERAAGALLAGLGLIVLCLAWRRFRLALLAAGAVVVALAVPHLAPLLVQAYPTSYVQSPTGFSAASILRGQTLFAANCARCHGTAGRGDGPDAAGLAVPPADLTAAHLWDHADGELFWWLTHGMDAPEGGLSMPGFGAALDEDDRWALIDYIRANNAGRALRRTGAWPVPLAAPDLPVICADGRAGDMAMLRGQVVAVLAAVPPPAGATPAPVVPLSLAPRPGLAPEAGACAAASPEPWGAYAVLTGVDPAALGGTVVLVDPAGWLRAATSSDDLAARPGLFADLLAPIFAQPITEDTGEPHAHHHH